MNISNLKHDKEYILSILHDDKDSNTTRVKEDCSIIIPAKFTETNLASLGADNYIVGIFAIVSNGKYSTMICNAMVMIEPSLINDIEIDGDAYLEFVFPKGTTMIKNMNVVRQNTITYRIFDYFIANARIPWYLSYNQIAKIFSSARDYADANIGFNHETDELLASIIARNSKDRTVYYRQIATSDNDSPPIKPKYVSLKNIAYSATNTMAKLSGNYFTDGTISALVTPTERVETMDRLLRA